MPQTDTVSVPMQSATPLQISVQTPPLSRLPPALAKAMKEGDEASIAAAKGKPDGADPVQPRRRASRKPPPSP